MGMSKVNHLFSFGLGYSAKNLSRVLHKRGWQISGTSRNLQGVAKIKEAGFTGHIFNDKTLPEKSMLDGVTHMLLSIPPNTNGDPVYLALKDEIAERAGQFKWVGYLSTTGVYGDRNGGWVDEETPVAPSTERGEKRVLAEKQWLDLFDKNQLALNIFRLAGIYGPGSNQLEKVLSGKARRRIKPGQVFSRIHVDDITGILAASIEKPSPGRIYNVCDDEAAPPQDVVTHAAELLAVEPPPEIPFDPDQMTPMGLSFFAESKRVSNDRVKSELGIDLKFPTYREGLQSLLSTLAQGK